MSKDRNTMAKRQREAEKRDKAARKREKREKRQSQPTPVVHGSHEPETDSDVADA